MLLTIPLLTIPLNALLALAAALLWGGGDFSGGMSVRKAGGTMPAAMRVVLISHGTALAVLLAIAFLHGDAFPHGPALAWSIGAGLIGNLSVCLFYIALSRGAMGAPAAVSGLLAAAIPAILSGVIDGAPGTWHLAGFCLAGAAIWLIAAGPGDTAVPGKPAAGGTMLLAVVSGAGFGIYFIALKFAGAAGVVTPMAIARLSSVCLTSVILLGLALRGRNAASRTGVKIGRTVLLWALGTAIMDTSGNMFFVAATRAGRLDIASVLASLYPATTILLAASTLREKPTRRQGLGMGLAAAAVVMITL